MYALKESFKNITVVELITMVEIVQDPIKVAVEAELLSLEHLLQILLSKRKWVCKVHLLEKEKAASVLKVTIKPSLKKIRKTIKFTQWKNTLTN